MDFLGMVHFLQNDLYKLFARSRGFLPRFWYAVRNRGYKIVKDIINFLNHAQDSTEKSQEFTAESG